MTLKEELLALRGKIDSILETLSDEAGQSIERTHEMDGHKGLNATESWYELELSVRARRAVRKLINPEYGEKIGTISDLVQYSEDDLLDLKNCGPTTVREIVQKLQEKGFRLSDKRRKGLG